MQTKDHKMLAEFLIHGMNFFLEVTQKYPQRNCMKVGSYRENYIV